MGSLILFALTVALAPKVALADCELATDPNLPGTTASVLAGDEFRFRTVWCFFPGSQGGVVRFTTTDPGVSVIPQTAAVSEGSTEISVQVVTSYRPTTITVDIIGVGTNAAGDPMTGPLSSPPYIQARLQVIARQPPPMPTTMTVDPAAGVYFGFAPLNQFTRRPLVVTNTGNSPLVGTLSIDPPYAGFSLSSQTLNVAPQRQATYQVEFLPTSVGTADGSLIINSNASQRSIALPLSGRAGLVRLWLSIFIPYASVVDPVYHECYVGDNRGFSTDLATARTRSRLFVFVELDPATLQVTQRTTTVGTTHRFNCNTEAIAETGTAVVGGEFDTGPSRAFAQVTRAGEDLIQIRFSVIEV